MKLSVIMPVYNEKNTIGEILQRIREVPINKEIIIVDDYSTDGTGDILQQENQDDTRILTHHKNLGKGSAIRTALTHVTGNIIIIQDGDLEYDPQDYLKLIKPISEGKTDVVYGSRI
jgi:glycosyltransferase involved in cell wall biosynthesis